MNTNICQNNIYIVTICLNWHQTLTLAKHHQTLAAMYQVLRRREVAIELSKDIRPKHADCCLCAIQKETFANTSSKKLRKQVYDSSPQPLILHSARCENTLIVEPDRFLDDPWGTRHGGKFRAVELTCWVVEIARQDDLRLIISMSHSFGKKNASSKWAHLPRFSVWKQHTCKHHQVIY